MRTANVLKATRQIADEALYRSFASGGTPSVLPAASFLIYFMKGGNDVTGNGTDEEPFLTATKALAFAHSLGPTLSQPALVLGGPGTYTETVQIPPNTFLCGMDGGFTLTIGTGSSADVSISPDWVGVTCEGGIEELIVLGDVLVDFTGSVNSDFTFGESTAVIGATTFTGANGNGVGFFQAELTGPATFRGAGLSSLGTLFSGLVTFASTATQTVGVVSEGDIYGSGITLDATAGLNVTVDLLDSGVASPLTLHDGGGGVTSYTATAEGIPLVVTLVGGAATPVLLTAAPAIKYAPAVPGNWVGPAPTTVQQALDRIAANVGNAHPIP